MDHVVQAIGLVEIDLADHGPAAFGLDRFHYLPGPVLTAVVTDRHERTLMGEGYGHGPANPAAGAGYQGCFIFKSLFHLGRLTLPFTLSP